MDPAVIGVFIPIIAITMGMGLGAIGMWTQHKQKFARLELEREKVRAAGASGRVEEQAIQIAELEDRVRVLERIVTDGGYDLATRLDSFREHLPAEVLVGEDAATSVERAR